MSKSGSSKKSATSRMMITTAAKTLRDPVKSVVRQCKQNLLPSRSLHLFKPSAILIDLVNIATDAHFLDTVLIKFINNKVCIASQWDKVTAVYADVAVTLRKWHTEGIRLYAYGRTSKEVSKCIFSKTTQGNISALFTDFFDENSVGSLSCSEAFRYLANSRIHCSPGDIVFLGTNITEVQAAKDAGYRALVVKKTVPDVVIVRKREEMPIIGSVADLQLRPSTVPKSAPAGPVVVCNHEQLSLPKEVHLKSANTQTSKEKTRTQKISICVQAAPPKSAQKPVICCHSTQQKQQQEPRSTRAIKIIVPNAKSRAYLSDKKSSSSSSSKSKSSSKSGSASKRYSSKSDSSSSSLSKSKSDSSGSSSKSASADPFSSGSSTSGSSTSGSNTSSAINTSSTSGSSIAAPSGATMLNNLIYNNSSSQNSDSSTSQNK